MAYPYDGEYYAGSTLLVLYNRVFGVIFAFVMSSLTAEDMACSAPLWKYVFISVTAVAASICQYEALKYISFAVQMLGKSCKMVPVMLWGMMISGKTYVTVDWVTSLVVTGFVAEFLLTGDITAENNQGTSTYGLLMLVGFVALDGFTATFQEKLFRDHLTSKYNQMFYINVVSAGITFVSLIVSGFTNESFAFCQRHPSVVADASLLSAAAVAAQWFIYSQVQEYGALAFAATMNLRQIVSIIASYIAYGHSITVAQIIGLCGVGTTLLLRSFGGLIKDLIKDPTKEGSPLLRHGTLQKAPTLNFFKKTRAGCCPWKV
eukprot:CAMPEP_0171093614 /NCGR_PEP_ID=MMETSP0766_2-20121228/39184_1 /TAXON_ID=439317 /ORGANISM="Gambierdiscus australes, Strain CAWD 149" /LENGTH=318 /DNA_ID=CAMNT_0011552091 /DNA_START=154 /DNA_END=1110 /DNA_ORIENTATION=+